LNISYNAACFILISTMYKTDNIKICLLGPSFDTGNLGVSVLAEGSIKCILNRWPDARVTLLGSGWKDDEHQLHLLGRETSVKSLPIRFCRNVFLPNHFGVLLGYALLLKVFRWQRLRKILAERNPYVKTIIEADMVADITGGDSFSDVYGMRRFLIGFLRKWLIKVFEKKLVFLPQTYGPFNKQVTAVLARHILRYASVVYSRDRDGVDYVKNFLNVENADQKIKFVPDVGFIIDPRRPESADINSLEKIKAANQILVGLNISGLLTCTSDTANNMFNLKVDYPALVGSIIELLTSYDGVAVLLVPHLVASPKRRDSRDRIAHRKTYEQSDETVCTQVYEQTAGKYSNRIFLAPGHYNHNQMKYVIGLCDFFIGSRMHACIAALSQNIPAVGLAYSKKFAGVFESVGAEKLVVDMRRCTQDEILAAIRITFEKRQTIAETLRSTVPDVQAKVLSIFKDFQ